MINFSRFQVSGAGYVSSRKSIGVTCSPSDCSLCAPSIMVPLSPGLGKSENASWSISFDCHFLVLQLLEAMNLDLHLEGANLLRTW